MTPRAKACQAINACQLIARAKRSDPVDVARQHFADDRDLRAPDRDEGAVAPAQTSVAGWAAELAAIMVQDIADNLLPQSALAQLRATSGLCVHRRRVSRACRHIAPTPSGGFVAEAGRIPVGALILGRIDSETEKGRRDHRADPKELLTGSPLNVEMSLRTLLAQDIGLMIDGILLGNAADHGHATGRIAQRRHAADRHRRRRRNALLGDIKKLLAAIAPAIQPVLIVNSTQAASVLAPTSAVIVRRISPPTP